MSTAVQKSDSRWTIRLQPADRFSAVQCPDWAQKIARQHCPSAHVRLGQVGTSGHVVEVVTVTRYRHSRPEAVDLAEEIAEAIEP